MQVELISIQDIKHSDRQAMMHLLEHHFDGINPAIFEMDLAQKNWVILLKDDDLTHLKGFSTLLLYETHFAGEVFDVIYSGDTIVDPSAWSSPLLAQAWIAAIRTIRPDLTRRKLYWLLISSGFRTYRFLPIFCKEFYPCLHQVASEFTQQLMHHLAIERFQQDYDPLRGIVKFPHPQKLRGSLQGIPDGRQSDPHIQFFHQRNPGHEEGDELVCLAEFSEANLTRAGKRLWLHPPTFANIHFPLAQ